MENPQLGSRVQRSTAALLTASVVAIWLALLGPVWTYLPATTTTPPSAFTFADLAAATALGADGIQAAFYQWIAWAFAVATTVAVVIALRSGRRSAGMACAVVGVVQLLVTLYVSVEAAPDLSVLLSNLKYTRLGSVLFFGSMIALIVAGAQLFSGRNARVEHLATTAT